MTTTVVHDVYMIEKSKEEMVNMVWNIDQFLKDTGRDMDDDITNQDCKGSEKLGWKELDEYYDREYRS